MTTQLPAQQSFPFPVWTLPPRIRAAIEEAIAVTQAPPALVASSALAAASLAVQTKFDVKRMSGLISPCSLYFITFAESGERKTTVDHMFFASFRKFEELSHNFIEEKGTNEDVQPTNEPRNFGRIRILYADTTPAAFAAGLTNNSRSAGLCEDEAGRIFNGRLVDDLGLLNKIWDGSDITIDRKRETLCIRSPRGTVNWMVQPSIFTKFMERKGDDARGIGFLSRCLPSYPFSTQGTRFIRSRPECLEEIEKFNDRILQLLNDQMDLLRRDHGETSGNVVLSFSTQAQFEWENIFNNIEYSIRPGGEFCEARDYASKVAENIARLAGVFHAFEGTEGTRISMETLSSATNAVLWYTREFVRLFSPPAPQEIISGYARLLDSWLIEFAKSTGKNYILRNDLLQLGPNRLRSRDILNIAVERLSATNRVRCNTVYPPPVHGRKTQKGTHVLELNDGYYGQIARGHQPWGFEQL